jgi:DNA-binding NtrC family response regulator
MENTMKLLLLEDDEFTGTAAVTCVEPLWPGTVRWVKSLNHARQILSGPHYVALFVSDLQVPDGNGLTLLKEARERDWLTFTSTCIITSIADRHRVSRAKELQVDHFMVKPVNVELLARLVQMVCDNICSMNEQTQGMGASVEPLWSAIANLQQDHHLESNLVQIQRRALAQGCHSLAQAIHSMLAYLRMRLVDPHEMRRALEALSQHAQFLIHFPMAHST